MKIKNKAKKSVTNASKEDFGAINFIINAINLFFNGTKNQIDAINF